MYLFLFSVLSGTNRPLLCSPLSWNITTLLSWTNAKLKMMKMREHLFISLKLQIILDHLRPDNKCSLNNSWIGRFNFFWRSDIHLYSYSTVSHLKPKIVLWQFKINGLSLIYLLMQLKNDSSNTYVPVFSHRHFSNYIWSKLGTVEKLQQ